MPPGLNPKDYRSLKTQYLQVSLLGAPRRASTGRGIAACLLLAMGHHAAVLPRDVPAACRGWCEPRALPAPQGALSSLLGLLPVPTEVARCYLVCAGSQGSVLIPVTPPQSYGPEHLLTFHNLKRIGLLTEQAAGETLTAVESRVSKLVTDRAAGESQSHGEPRGRAAHGRELLGWGQSRGWCWLCCPFPARAWCLHSHRAPAGSCCTTSRGSELLLSSFPGKITDAFNSLARKSNFRAISKKLGLVRPGGLLGCCWPESCARPVPWLPQSSASSGCHTPGLLLAAWLTLPLLQGPRQAWHGVRCGAGSATSQRAPRPRRSPGWTASTT